MVLIWIAMYICRCNCNMAVVTRVTITRKYIRYHIAEVQG